MITKILTISELKELFVQDMLNATSEVTKISDESVLNGVAYGNAKVAQKTLKEISLVEQHLFPDSAYSTNLDDVANFMGIAARFTALGSSTHILLVGTPGTVYSRTTHTFTGSHGLIFKLNDNTVTIPAEGYIYAQVNSVSTGLKTNVNPQSITRVSPIPTGHSFCLNEYMAIGGQDAEDDTAFRKRIKDGCNLAATGTLAKLTQIFQKYNSNVLRVVYNGITTNGKISVTVLTTNGVDLTAGEITNLELAAWDFLSLTELRTYSNNSYSFEISNMSWYNLAVDFRVDIKPDYTVVDVMRDIQIKMTKELDFRFWDNTKKIEWDNLLGIVKYSPGVNYVLDENFVPSVDLKVPNYQFPRVYSFIMRNIDGTILGSSNVQLPYYYPNIIDKSFQLTMLSSL
jgi:hypothetical protein